MTSKEFGYIRVSTAAQSLDRQTDALTNAGIPPADIYADKISGVKQARPGLDALLRIVREGDTITVVSLDRLGRSALHIMQTIAELTERGIQVRSLKSGEDMEGPTGQLLRAIMIHIAEWERQMMLERVAESRAAREARAPGEQSAGRPRTALTPASMKKIRSMREANRSVAEITKVVGLPRSTVYRALEEMGVK